MNLISDIKDIGSRLRESRLAEAGLSHKVFLLEQQNKELLEALEMLRFKLDNHLPLTPSDNKQVATAIAKARGKS